MSVGAGARAMEAASATLWRERHVLEVLLLKLETEEALAVSGRVQWLPFADHELHLVLEEARSRELAAAVGWKGVPGSADLIEPWATIFSDHRVLTDRLLLQVAVAAARWSFPEQAGPARGAVGRWAQKRIHDTESIDLSGGPQRA